MAKSKSHQDDEDLRGKFRELQKENRALRRRLRQLEKNRNIWEQYNLDSDETISAPIVIEDPKCPSCKHGRLLVVDLGIRVLTCCDACSYRKTTDGQG